AVCAVDGNDNFLGFACHSRLVAAFRIRGGRIRARDNGRGTLTYSSTVRIERKKSQQSHAASALQRVLLLASNAARTGTRAADRRLTQAPLQRALFSHVENHRCWCGY